MSYSHFPSFAHLSRRRALSLLPLFTVFPGLAGPATSYAGRTVLSPYDFGAVGNGLNDDTVALQRAIDAAAQGSRTITFPRATYAITKTLAVPPGFSIDFGGSTVRRLPGRRLAFDLVRCDASGTTDGTLNLRNVVLDGNKDADGMAAVNADDRFCGLRLRRLRGGRIEGVTVLRTVNAELGSDPSRPPTAGILLDECWSVTLDRVAAYANDRSAIMLHRSTRCAVSQVHAWTNVGSGVTSFASPDCSYRFITCNDNGYSNLSINGERSQASDVLSWGSAYSGINVGHAISPSHQTRLSNVRSYDNQFEGITISHSSDVLVTDFEFWGNARNNVRVMVSNASRFSDGVSRSSRGGQGFLLEGGSGHVIESCNVFRNAYSGVYAADCGAVRVGRGVRAYNNGQLVSRNTAGVILLRSRDCRLDSVQAFDDQARKTQEAGIWIAGGSGHVLMSCRIQGNAAYQLRQTSGPTGIRIT